MSDSDSQYDEKEFTPIECYKKATDAVKEKKTQKAIDWFSRAIDLETSNPFFYCERAQFYYDEGYFDDAAKDLESAIAFLNADSDPRLWRGAYWLKGCMSLTTGSPRNAVDDFNTAFEYGQAVNRQTEADKQMLISILAHRANANYLSRKYKDAAADYETVLEKNPHHVVALANRAMFLLEMENDSESALQLVSKALEREPENANVMAYRAHIHYIGGDWDKALADASKASATNKNCRNARYLMGLLAKSSKNDTLILKDFSVACINASDKTDDYRILFNVADAQMRRAEALSRVGSYLEAIGAATMALKQNPTMSEAYLFRGRAYLGQGEYQNAVNDFTRLIGLDNGNAIAYFERGVVFETTKNLNEAISDFSSVISLDGHHARAYFLRASCRVSQMLGSGVQDGKALSSALADLSASHAINGGNSEVHALRAAIFHCIGESQKALEDLEEAQTLDPNRIEIYLRRGNIYGDMGDYDNAVIAYTTALDKDATNITALISRASIFAKLPDQYERAIADFDRAIEIDPENKLAWLSRGMTYLDRNLLGKAAWDFTQCIELKGTCVKAMIWRGVIFARMLKWDLAILDFEVVLDALPPNSPDRQMILYELARALFREGKLDRAEKEARDCLSLGQKYTSALILLGQILLAKGQTGEAIRMFGTASETDPYSPLPLMHRGILYSSEMKQHSLALRDLTSAIRVAPKLPQLYALRAQVSERLMRMDDAVADYTAAIDLYKGNPDSWISHNNRGLLAIKRKLFHEAASDLHAAVRFKSSFITHNNRGYFFKKTGNYVEAQEDYDEAFDRCPCPTVSNNRAMMFFKRQEHSLALGDFAHVLLQDPSFAPVYNNRGRLHREMGMEAEAAQDFFQATELNPTLYKRLYAIS